MDGEIEQPLQEQPLPALSIEAGENPAQDLLKSESDRPGTFYQTVMSVIAAFIVVAFSGYKDMKPLYSTTGHNKAHLRNLLIAGCFFIIVTFLCAVVLMMFVLRHGQRGRRTCSVLIILVGVTGTMLIVSDTLLVVVMNRSNVLLSAVLAPELVLVIVAASAGAWFVEVEQPGSTTGSRYHTAMKGTFDVAAMGTMASFTLQGTVGFGYLKSPEGKRDPPLDLAVCYLTSTFCLSAMMICAMPMSLLPGNMLENLARCIERLRHAALAALALMTLVVSVEFLDGFAVLSFCPEAIALVLHYAVEFFSARPRRGENLPFLDLGFRTVAGVSFTLMAGLYAAFLGTDHYSVYLKAAMSVLLMAVLSSLSRLAMLPEMGGAVEIGIAGVVLAFPAAALLAACPLVLKVVLELYQNR
ncbi:hypothetical protein EJB05_18599 [Eragrostis curvula]|uniref:Uncharacterized protein n=1 Tax=Eragrostis curvula TaxID=38414 RepID=A0A5J9VMG2_9POAL|nr:hypothetical protein EJB05_18599 [Eragrostis curvula]